MPRGKRCNSSLVVLKILNKRETVTEYRSSYVKQKRETDKQKNAYRQESPGVLIHGSGTNRNVAVYIASVNIDDKADDHTREEARKVPRKKTQEVKAPVQRPRIKISEHVEGGYKQRERRRIMQE